MKFEFEFVGYMDLEDKEKALELGYKLEEKLGELTKDTINLYLSNVEKHE